MEPEYILLICAGGVLLLLLLVYLIAALEIAKVERRNLLSIYSSYSEENLKRMEYDIAFYDRNSFKLNYSSDTTRQVTIDDVLGGEEENAAKLAENAVFTQVEDKGVEVVSGRFNPSK